MERIYFDYAATAPLRPTARAAMMDVFDTFGNSSSAHREGQAARAILDDSRRLMADLLGVRAERIVFTSGGTEANNLAIRGLLAGGNVRQGWASAVEHDCVRNTAAALGLGELPVGGDGTADLRQLAAITGNARQGPFLVSVMHANNETGVVQPVGEIAKMVKAAGGIFHTDAVQTVGHMPVDADEIGADLLSFSAHKFGGPKGVGALVVKSELAMQALLTGGAQERNRRAGTENVAGIAGMAAALREATENMREETARAMEIGMIVREGLRSSPVQEVAAGTEKLPHILQFVTPGKRGEDVVIGMDLRGVAVSQGSACSSGRVQASHVLRAMGYSEREAGEGVRLSWGWASRVDEAARVVGGLKEILETRH